MGGRRSSGALRKASQTRQGKSDAAYKLFFERVHGFNPAKLVTETVALPNAPDWPTSLQLSHLCHRRACCRVDNIALETSWRNSKRNYCGIFGFCDCSIGKDPADTRLHPACKRVYSKSPETTSASPTVQVLRGLHVEQLGGPIGLQTNVCLTREEVADVLNRTGFPFKYSFVDYMQRDAAASVRAAKRAARSVANVPVIEEDVEEPDEVEEVFYEW